MDWQVTLWRERAGRAPAAFGEAASASGADAAQWSPVCILRGHCADVHALAWAPRAESLFSGDIEGATIVWNLSKAIPEKIVREHEHYVLGVAWDPADEHLVSVSCDRTVRLYASGEASTAVANNAKRDFECHTILSKRTHSATNAPPRDKPAQPTPPPAGLQAGATEKGGAASSADKEAEMMGATTPAAPTASGSSGGVSKFGVLKKEVNLFLDDSVNSFYRRPDWSPDGSFLLLPCGQYFADAPPPAGSPSPTTFVFARHDLTTPCAHLPSPDKPVIALRCSPVLYEHRAPSQPPASPGTPAADAAGESAGAAWMASLPYRVLWAAATLDSVVVYDSSLRTPLLSVSNLHYEPLTDIAWLPDGNGVIASAGDGYCTLLRFRPGVLGTPVPQAKLPACMRPAEKPAAPPAATAAAPTLLQVRRKPQPQTVAPTVAPTTAPSSTQAAAEAPAAPTSAAASASAADGGQAPPAEAPEVKKPRRMAPTFVSPL